jgi:hypothetical protein
MDLRQLNNGAQWRFLLKSVNKLWGLSAGNILIRTPAIIFSKNNVSWKKQPL